MSPEEVERSGVDSRIEGLIQVRRWLIQLLFSEAWLFAALAGASTWPALPTQDRAFLLIGAACIVVGWILGRRTVGQWLILAAPLSLILAAALSTTPPSGPTWIALAVSVGHVTYGLVLLLPVRLAPLVIPVGCAVLTIVWSWRPGNVVPGALAVAGGWISVVSLGASASALWFAWRALLQESEAEDGRLRTLSARIQQEVATQERSRMWRSAAITVHERLLSTLRYILQTDTLDRPGLTALVGARSSRVEHASSADLAEDVREATAARIAAGLVRIESSALDLPLEDDVRLAARAAIVECALNAVLHGDATDVVVSAQSTGDRWVVSVSDNGVGIGADAVPGIGWSSTLGEGLAAIGGTWSVARQGGRTMVRLDLPGLKRASGPAFAEDGFQQGRVLMSAPLIAVGVVGVTFDAIIAMESSRGWPLLGVAILASLGALMLVIRGRRPGLLASSAVLAGLAAIPWLMALARPNPDLAPTLAAGLTTAGYSIIAVGMWSRWWQWLVSTLAWAAGVLLVAHVDGGDEQLPIAIALINCLIIVPVVIIVTAIGTRRYRRSREAEALERDAMRREVTRANAAMAIDNHLSACVAQAEDIIEQLAGGADLDEASRRQVACLEGLIRATIQVDPLSSGEVTQVAARLVNSAFSESKPIRVGTLLASSDDTPLALQVTRALEDAIREHSSVTIRTLTDGTRDHLTLELAGPRAGAEAALRCLRQVTAPGVEIDVSTDVEDGVVVMVSRSISVPA